MHYLYDLGERWDFMLRRPRITSDHKKHTKRDVQTDRFSIIPNKKLP